MEGALGEITIQAGDEPGGGPRYRAAELDRHLGQRLRFVRRLAGWSQRELGGRLGMTFQQMQKYENGSNRMPAALLAELSGLFHLPLDWFVGPYAAAPTADRADTYPALLDLLFRHDDGRDDGGGASCIATICRLASQPPGKAPEGRLESLRRALTATTATDRAFLLEAARRMLEQGPAAPAPQPEARPAPEKARGNVMLVDDDPDIIATLSVALGNAGFVVTAAASGDEALRLLSCGAAADVLVTDYAMFGMDGVELLAQAGVLRPGLPGLVITGFADSARLQDLPPGVEVLRKPFRRMELIGRLRLLLERLRLDA